MSGCSPRVTFPSGFTEFRLVLSSPASFKYKDFVATFRFFDHAGNPLSDSDLDATFSRKLGANFRYLLSSSVALGESVVKPIRLRKPAQSVDVDVRPWLVRDRNEANAVKALLFAVATDTDRNFIWAGRIGAK